MDRVPLILDVDTGIDDALALLYAAASPEAELVAVTCLPGNAALADVTRNTRAVLELAGRTDVGQRRIAGQARHGDELRLRARGGVQERQRVVDPCVDIEDQRHPVHVRRARP